MSAKDNFPEWIVGVVSENKTSINKNSHEYFERVKNIYPDFSKEFINIPNNVELGVLKSHNPSEVFSYYKNDGPLEFIVFNVYETFHFIFVYQIRELSQMLQECLMNGRFLGAAIISRSIFELVCTTYYTFRRVEHKFFECMEIVKKILKTKSSVEKKVLTSQYHQKIYEIYSAIQRGNVASSIDWQDHMKKFGSVLSDERAVERIHIITAIDDIEKKSKMPLSKIYGLMSEFVHPNYGSKALIIKTLDEHDQLMNKLTIGENKNNAEAALFYIDQCSEGLYTTITLALSLVDRSVKLLFALDKITEDNKK